MSYKPQYEKIATCFYSSNGFFTILYIYPKIHAINNHEQVILVKTLKTK